MKSTFAILIALALFTSTMARRRRFYGRRLATYLPERWQQCKCAVKGGYTRDYEEICNGCPKDCTGFKTYRQTNIFCMKRVPNSVRTSLGYKVCDCARHKFVGGKKRCLTCPSGCKKTDIELNSGFDCYA